MLESHNALAFAKNCYVVYNISSQVFLLRLSVNKMLNTTCYLQESYFLHINKQKKNKKSGLSIKSVDDLTNHLYSRYIKIFMRTLKKQE